MTSFKLDEMERFVLLDDARKNGASPARLYHSPIAELSAQCAADIPALLENLRAARADGLNAAGYLHYDAGMALEPKLAGLATANERLAWFGLFEDYSEIASNDVQQLLPDGAGAWAGPFQPDISAHDYAEKLDTLLGYVRAGDIYQANFTFRAQAAFAGHPAALYARIRARAAAGYGGLIHDGHAHTLSFSPEIFFALRGRRVTTRPMKGTGIRHADPAADAAAATELARDPKQRAENLMIVDLLRNDLSRICEAGSVEVPALFAIESYPTVHQMVSTVTGELATGKDAVDCIAALFPCGSITGAPKIRAIEIIDELESSPRGLYCGGIGRIDACGDAAFNVAIRTISVDKAKKALTLGLGSGIVADSKPAAEWSECLAKGEFARMTGPSVDLIETIRFEPAEGLLRLEWHLERMKASATALGYAFDRHAARNQLNAVCFHLTGPARIRLLASASGAIAIEMGALPAQLTTPVDCAVCPLPVASHDYRLIHKTTDRAFYDEARLINGSAEVLFHDADGFLTEGSFSNLFVEKDGQLITPPACRGLLSGILRRELLESSRAKEGDVTISDLGDGFFIGNSLRGLLAAKLKSI